MLRQFFNVSTYNIAEWIPFLRIVAVPFIFATILMDVRVYTGILFLAIFASDALDGFVARTYNLVTRRFAILDSTGDVLMLLIGIYGFYFYETAFFLDNLPVISITIGLYLLQQTISLIRFGKITSFHTVSAKAAAVVQAVFLASMFIFGVIPWLFIITIAISIIETVEEILLIFIIREWQYNLKGLYWILKKKPSSSTQDAKQG